MSTDAAILRQIKRYGGGQVVELRRPVTLYSGPTGAPIDTLRATTGASIGDTSLELQAANLDGSIPAGAVLTIGATDYATEADAEAASGRISIELSAGLESALTAGDEVTVSDFAALELLCMVSRPTDRQLAGTVVEVSDRMFSVYSPTVAIGTEDKLFFEGETLDVKHAGPYQRKPKPKAFRVLSRG